MNRRIVTRRVIPLLIGMVLSLSVCAGKNYVYDGPYYDRWGFWDGCCGFGRYRFAHDGWQDGFVRPAGAGFGTWHGGWGHGFAGHGGFGGTAAAVKRPLGTLAATVRDPMVCPRRLAATNRRQIRPSSGGCQLAAPRAEAARRIWTVKLAPGDCDNLGLASLSLASG
jgi:hypothetical protein